MEKTIALINDYEGYVENIDNRLKEGVETDLELQILNQRRSDFVFFIYALKGLLTD